MIWQHISLRFFTQYHDWQACALDQLCGEHSCAKGHAWQNHRVKEVGAGIGSGIVVGACVGA